MMDVTGKALLALAILPAIARPVAAQSGSIVGRVTEVAISRPLAGARLQLLDRGGAVSATASTDNQGRASLSGIPPGAYTLAVALIGYRPERLANVRVVEDDTAEVAIQLAPLIVELNPTVVSASRYQEKALDAPASVAVVTAATIEEQPAATPVEHVRDAPGVDMATAGIIQSHIVTRGFNGVFSGSLLILTDNRYDFVPSLRVNAPWLIPSVSEDIARVELVLGPAAALYGPNASAGVLHIFTKSPLDWSGTTLSLGAATRAANETGGAGAGLRSAIRHAGTVGSKLGYKVTAQYFSGEDWLERDSAEVTERRRALALGADERTLRIGRRESGVRRWSAEARADYSPDARTDVVLTLGRTDAGSVVALTGVGAAQVRDWRYDYYHIRARRDQLFAQAFVNANNAGDTYLLRTGQSIVDRSRMAVAQVQHAFDWGARQSFVYGLDAQRTIPRTGGTTTGRNENDDEITEVGAYLQAETHLSQHVRLVAAGRVDSHNRLQSAVVSPRAAIVVKPNASHTFRLTYNRAFDTPSTDNLFLDIVAGTLTPVPLNVRAVGVPVSGMTFRRDCAGGLCMRSPFASSPAQPLPLDATLVWPAFVGFVQSLGGPDLRGIPAPTAADVRSNLRVLNITDRSFSPATPADVRDVPRLRETTTNTVELGYKGVIDDRVQVAFDVYYERKENFIGPPIVETPNVFLEAGRVGEPGALATYLARYMSAADAQHSATLIGGIRGSSETPGAPVGTVAPEHWLAGSTDVLLTFRNFGALARWGADVAGQVKLSDELSVSAAYSWTSRDLFPRAEVGGFSDIALNAPANKASVIVQSRDPRRGLSMHVRGRYAAGFPMNSGVYVGRVESYALADVGFAYRLPRSPGVVVTASAQNVFNHQHREFLGAPVIGRAVFVQAQYTFR
jgi:outer membrane receptor for ferrienterochelin and colicins